VSSDLHKQLESLHSELARTNQIDREARDLLVQVLNDISRLLDPSKPNPADEQTLTSRLDEVAVRFEAEHPTLGIAIRRVVDTLAKAGI
jgi:uncharacterized membrane protein affecting hemolysin expression